MFIGKPRRLIRKLVRNVGFQRRIAPDFVDIMNDLDIDVVFDVGANDGGFGRDIRDRGYMGQIVSFEPFSSAYNRLCLAIRGDSKWKAYPIALGSEDTEVASWEHEQEDKLAAEAVDFARTPADCRHAGDIAAVLRWAAAAAASEMLVPCRRAQLH